jgi:hypothetical protein
MSVIIVPRGCHSDYYAYLAMTADANGDTLIVDRRVAERRSTTRFPVDRQRPSDRRGPPPVTWTRGGLIVIPAESS